MRVGSIRSYSVPNSTLKNRQVNFGLIDKDSETEVLGILSRVAGRRKEEKTDLLRMHKAVTLYAKGGNLHAKINPGYEKVYNLLNYKNFDKPNYLVDLEEQDQFDDFYRRLTFIDDDRAGIKVSDGCTIESKSSWEEDLESGFGLKTW